MAEDREKAIGIFDSGIGGLTVVREVLKTLPNEKLVYLGDTARVPYGSKSARTVKGFTLQNCLFLLENHVKLIVIACNTASAIALDFVASMFRVPVIGVVVPGSAAAVAASKNRKVGVIGTHSTISSDAYARAIQARDASVEVKSKACPMFVPLAEEGWVDHPATLAAVSDYLGEFGDSGIDTLVLGCTHYPILKPAIRAFLGPEIKLIDSGVETARAVKTVLSERDLAKGAGQPDHKFFVTDLPGKFREIGERFLGRSLGDVEVINVENIGF